MNFSLHEKALLCIKNYKRSEVGLIDVLTEIDRTRLYLSMGVSSLFQYCTKKLSLSESETYRFIQVTRKSVQVPELREAIREGMLTTTKASRIASIITPANQKDWIQKASTLSHRELEKEIVKIKPKTVKPERIQPKTSERIELRINISPKLEQKFRRAQEVLGTKTLEETLEKMTDFTLKHKDPLQRAERVTRQPAASVKSSPITLEVQANGPRKFSHYIPAPLSHAVNLRDKRCCQFKGCSEKMWVEIHHVLPISMGGRHELSNLITLCSPHHSMMHSFRERIHESKNSFNYR